MSSATNGFAPRLKLPTSVPAPSAMPMTRASSPCRNSPRMWWKPPENLRRGIDQPARRPTQGEPEIVTKLRDGFEGVER